MSRPEIATDVWGDEWRVHDSRETPHGFAVKLGSHVQEYRGTRSLIATEPLVEFLLNRAEFTAPALELPVSHPTVQRLRQRLGITEAGFRGKWWEDRVDDLRSLGASEFARKHGVTRTLVHYHRRRLLKRYEPA